MQAEAARNKQKAITNTKEDFAGLQNYLLQQTRYATGWQRPKAAEGIELPARQLPVAPWGLPDMPEDVLKQSTATR